MLAGPLSFVAFGGGLGMAPKAPGTFGTLLGIPLFLVMPDQPGAYLLTLALLFLFGIWCCAAATRRLRVHDHPGIVWDEVVGLLVALYAAPRTALCIAIGFVLFRIFDVLKPWPIGWIDRRVHGGFGIMLDDVLAGLFALAAMHVLVLPWV